MGQPPVDNQTDFIVHPQVLVDRDGEKLVAVVKATWELPPGATQLELAPEKRMRAIRPIDVPWGMPGETTSMLPSDLFLRRPGTDVIVVARAYSSGGKPRPHFDVSARVGPVQKMLRVFGLRVWQGGGMGMSQPRPITELDLRFEYAWGGIDMNDDGDVKEEPRNPMGRGIALDTDSLTHRPAPQIEDPFNLIQSVDTKPVPAGFCPIMPHWEPRRSFHGTYDQAWLDERAPLTPTDHDDRANICAPEGLHADVPLQGGEEVGLAGLVPGGGGLEFALPRIGIELEFRRPDHAPTVVRPHLDTVVIDQLFGSTPGRPLVEMVWRASVVAPVRMQDSEVVVREVKP